MKTASSYNIQIDNNLKYKPTGVTSGWLMAINSNGDIDYTAPTTSSSNKDYFDWVWEDFPTQLGRDILLISRVAGAGVASSTQHLNASDINSSLLINRYGLNTQTLNSATSNSRGTYETTEKMFRFYNTSGSTMAFATVTSVIAGSQVDMANDPLLIMHCALMDNTALANPTLGVYIRPPRVTESSTYKLVYRNLTSVEVDIVDTGCPYDSTPGRFLYCELKWDQTNNRVVGTIKCAGNTYVSYITSVFPSKHIANVPLLGAYGVIRLGTATASNTPFTIACDRMYRYVPDPYKY